MMISLPDLMEKAGPAPAWDLSVRLAPGEEYAIREQTREQLAGLLAMSGPIDSPENVKKLRGLFLKKPPAAEKWEREKISALLAAVFAYAKRRERLQVEAIHREAAKFIEQSFNA
jgi:hypothetical protein